MESLSEEVIAENFPNLGRKQTSNPGIKDSHEQDEPKEVHNRTHELKCQRPKTRENLKPAIQEILEGHL